MTKPILLSVLMVTACDFSSKLGDLIPDINLCTEDIPDTCANIGDECDPTSEEMECRAGLACEGGTCELAGTTEACNVCVISGECEEGLGCTPFTGACPPGCTDCAQTFYGHCVPRGDTAEGELCGAGADIECADGLYCQLVGLAGICAPGGTGDINAACKTTANCYPGLWCSTAADTAGTCRPPTRAFDLFDGVECPDDEGEYRGYFEVATENDFYRLPFPNDAAVSGGSIDLGAHPTPGPSILGTDLMRTYLDEIESSFSGFSTLAVVHFRFSGGFNVDTVGDAATLVDVTPDAEEFGNAVSASWSIASQEGKFICANRLSLAAFRPLTGGNTYAAIVMNTLRSDEGATPQQDADFAAMLAASDPGNELSTAWNAYAPLRQYLASGGKHTASNVAVASVFTVQDALDPIQRVANVVRADTQASTSLSDVRLCTSEESAETACACSGAGNGFDEYHGLVSLPVMQGGTRPYLESGGEIEYSGGNPVVQGSEQVCFALAVPSGADPVDPLAVTVFAHGTGGTFTSGMTNGVAGELASRGIATFGFTGVLHDERKGGSELDSDILVFNFTNPPAARDNVLQGAADLFQIVKALQADTTTVNGYGFDPTKIFFFGHSQGSTTGGMAVPFEEGLRTVVLSGAGGHLVTTLVDKTSPFAIADGLGFLFNETVTTIHPMLTLLQTYFDRSDLINVANSYFRGAPSELRTNVLMTYGLGDTFTPPTTIAELAGAMRLSPVNPVLEEFTGQDPVDAPVTGNYTPGPEPDVTAVLVQVDPAGEYDGHFVAFRNDALVDRWGAFLESAAADPSMPPTLP